MPPRVRPPGANDAASVLQVIVARDVADLGVPHFTLDDLRADWATPGLELEHDVRVADAGGEIHGYAILLGDDAVVVVHPDAEGEGTGSVLRRWAEARASERGTAVLRQFAYGANDDARRLLRDAGYAPAQHYFRLRADLADVPPPAAVALRVFEPGDEAAAEMAVAARSRGRGLGRALLLGLFDAFRRAGLEHAELSVHVRNRGALALYESVGMRSTWEAERWEKALGR